MPLTVANKETSARFTGSSTTDSAANMHSRKTWFKTCAKVETTETCCLTTLFRGNTRSTKQKTPEEGHHRTSSDHTSKITAKSQRNNGNLTEIELLYGGVTSLAVTSSTRDQNFSIFQHWRTPLPITELSDHASP